MVVHQLLQARNGARRWSSLGKPHPPLVHTSRSPSVVPAYPTAPQGEASGRYRQVAPFAAGGGRPPSPAGAGSSGYTGHGSPALSGDQSVRSGTAITLCSTQRLGPGGAQEPESPSAPRIDGFGGMDCDRSCCCGTATGWAGGGISPSRASCSDTTPGSGPFPTISATTLGQLHGGGPARPGSQSSW